MTAIPVGPVHGQPLVAVLCSVPLLAEAVDAALEAIAEVRTFPARSGDTAGLLRWLRPDAVIVDCDDDARDAAVVADEYGLPLLHIALREPELRVFLRGSWQQVGNGEGPTPEAIRNVVAGALWSREGRIH